MAGDAVKIVIIGHVDHGKSTLIGRLLLDTNSLPKEKYGEIKKISKELGKEAELAFLADQLKEERELGITIDTTQVFLKTHKRNYIIIDAPGHVEFIKNMLTGATQADAALLIIDANEGIMEQTRRHLYLINMLGIDKAIVVFNKMDLVNYEERRFNEIKNELLKFLANLNMSMPYLAPISARYGDNISKRSGKLSWYKGPALLEVLDTLKIDTNLENKPLRFPVQDVYKMGGEDLVVGRIASGTMRVNQEIRVLPEDRRARVSAIKVFGGNKQTAKEGENIGVVFRDDAHIKRGAVISDWELRPLVANSFIGRIFWMSDEPLEIDKKKVLRSATQEVGCMAERIGKRINSSTLRAIENDSGKLSINEVGEVLFRTDEPIVIEKFSLIRELGRFVIESDSGVQGAGIIF